MRRSGAAYDAHLLLRRCSLVETEIMIDCFPVLADELLDDLCERERVSQLCVHELIAEVLEDDEIDIDHPLVSEILSRLDPFWAKDWGKTEMEH